MAALRRAYSHGGGTELDEPSRIWPWVRLALALRLFHFVIGEGDPGHTGLGYQKGTG